MNHRATLPRRRKFELVLRDLHQILKDPTREDPRFDLWNATSQLRDFKRELMRDAVKMEQLLSFAHALRCSNVPGCQISEKNVMEFLASVAEECCEFLEDSGFQRVSVFPSSHEVRPEWQPILGVLQRLYNYAMACFEFRRPSDSFGGKRRAFAFEILVPIGVIIDLPDALAQTRHALKNARSVESRQAALFLEVYFKERYLAPDDATMDALLTLAEKADYHSTAVQALNALVETGAIGDYEAFERIADWKSNRR